MSVNKVILIGNVGADPEVRWPEKDHPTAKLSLATNEAVGTSETQVTEWHTLLMSGNNARIAERYIRKGTRLYVEGKLRYKEYEDRYKINRRVAVIDVDRIEMLGNSNKT